MSDSPKKSIPGAGLAKGLATTFKTMTQRSVTAQYPDVKPELPPRSRGVIALLEENCTSCMLCARECPDWCIYIDSHKETVPAAEPGQRDRTRNVLDRFAIDYSLCMYCGICIEVCPFDALFWSPEFEYAEFDIVDMLHEKDRLREWMWTVPPPPAHMENAEEPKEVGVARKAVEKAAAKAAGVAAGAGAAASVAVASKVADKPVDVPVREVVTEVVAVVEVVETAAVDTTVGEAVAEVVDEPVDTTASEVVADEVAAEAVAEVADTPVEKPAPARKTAAKSVAKPAKKAAAKPARKTAAKPAKKATPPAEAQAEESQADPQAKAQADPETKTQADPQAEAPGEDQ